MHSQMPGGDGDAVARWHGMPCRRCQQVASVAVPCRAVRARASLSQELPDANASRIASGNLAVLAWDSQKLTSELQQVRVYGGLRSWLWWLGRWLGSAPRVVVSWQCLVCNLPAPLSSTSWHTCSSVAASQEGSRGGCLW